MWKYDHTKQQTDVLDGIIPRTQLEESAERLLARGFGGPAVVDILTTLSGINRSEVSFYVLMVFNERS